MGVSIVGAGEMGVGGISEALNLNLEFMDGLRFGISSR